MKTTVALDKEPSSQILALRVNKTLSRMPKVAMLCNFYSGNRKNHGVDMLLNFVAWREALHDGSMLFQR